jgi:hypothetical protein
MPKTIALVTGTGTVTKNGTVEVTTGIVVGRGAYLHSITAIPNASTGGLRVHDTNSATGTGTVASFEFNATSESPQYLDGNGVAMINGIRVVGSGTFLSCMVVYE